MTKFVYTNQQYMTATKSWVKNDQMSKNMEQVMNIKCNPEEGYSSLANITWKHFSRICKWGKNWKSDQKSRAFFYKCHISHRKFNILKFKVQKGNCHMKISNTERQWAAGKLNTDPTSSRTLWALPSIAPPNVVISASVGSLFFVCLYSYSWENNTLISGEK